VAEKNACRFRAQIKSGTLLSDYTRQSDPIMRLRTYISALIVSHVLLAAGPVYSDDSSRTVQNIVTPAVSKTEEAGDIDLPAEEGPQSGRKLLYFPSGDVYPPYAADPFRVGFGVQVAQVTKVGIANSSSSRIALRAGGSFGIVRSQPVDQPDLGWQVSIAGGFNEQNDIQHSLDNIGVDGHYGLLVTTAPVQGLAFKCGLLHVSSHVGDEYMERTGRLRIGYTRQELAAGVSWFMSKHWRVYGEAGSAYFMSNHELQKPWRTQLGLEFESAPDLWKGRMAWYAAVDSQSMQERDWRIDVAVQTGFVVRSAGRTWRWGVEWYEGRPPLGEFFQNTEHYISLGLWIDI
jgi:hypothetical protein